MANWLAIFDIGCASVAGALWYLAPQFGPWPLLIGLLPWAVRWRLTGRPAKRTSFDLPLGLFIATALVGVWSAYDKETAWGKFWLIIGAVLLFYAFVNWGVGETQRKAESQAWLLTIFGAGVAVYFMVTHDWDSFQAKIEWLANLGRALQSSLPSPPGHRLHPNVAGGLLAIMVPYAAVTVWLMKRVGGRWRFALALALGLVILFGLLLSMSRGAWLALSAATAMVGWWLIVSLLGRSRQTRRTIYFGGLVAGLASVLLLAALQPQLVETALEALPMADAGQSRLALYRNSLVLASDYPIVGAGLGGFMMLYSTYSLLIHVGFSVHSHNLFLNVAIEQGIFGLLALFWMWLLMGVAVWRGMGMIPSDLAAVDPEGMHSQDHSQISTAERSVLYAAALSLVVLLVHSLFDDPLYGSRGLLLLFVPLSFAEPVLQGRPGLSKKRRLAIWAVGAAIVLAVLLIWRRPITSIFNANLASVRQSKEELSRYEWPDWPIQDAVRRDIDMRPVVAGYEQALTNNPHNFSANRRLGQIELSLGEYKQALAHLEEAYRQAPWDNATRQLLGEAYLVNGRTIEGQVLWETVNDAQDQLAARRFWYKHIGEEDRISQEGEE